MYYGTPRMTMPPADAPCKNCENRHKNCHSECEGYKAFKEKRIAIRHKIREEYLIQSLLQADDCKKREKRRKRINVK